METCNILGVNIAVTNMNKTVNYIEQNLNNIKGKYICVSNVHTTVMSYDDEKYRNIQNSSILSLPDGGPLSMISRKKGFTNAERVTGPDLMDKIFKLSEEKGYTHYFYGSTEETLQVLEKKLRERYPKINIVGMYSPPFRTHVEVESIERIHELNEINPDFIWVGLGAPKQEIWMNLHEDKLNSLMIGVGAGFDYFANKIKRAPKWMQDNNLEWLYRLRQDPKRLFKRYFITNIKFIWLMAMKGKHQNVN